MPWQKQGSVSFLGHAEMRTPRWKLILQEAWNTIRILSAATTIMRITETVPDMDMETIVADTADIERLNREKRKRRKKIIQDQRRAETPQDLFSAAFLLFAILSE